MMRKFKRIDLTNATEDYFLKVGEEAYISFSNVTQVPLHIATQDGTYYELHLIPSVTGGTSGAYNGRFWLYPNNTTYSNAFYYAEFFRVSIAFNSNYELHNTFRIGWGASSITAWIINRTQYKNIHGIHDVYGTPNCWPDLGVFSCDWRDTTTPWTSLGTVVFQGPSSGEILVRRLK